MSTFDRYVLERSVLLGSYENLMLTVNGHFAMQFTVKHGQDSIDEPVIVGYMVKNPFSSEYYRIHGIEPVNSSACLDNASGSCYIPMSLSAYGEIETIMIRAYREFCNGFAVSRFGVCLDIEEFFSNM